VSTFEETLKSKTAEDTRLAELQATFVPTITELRTLRKTIQQSQARWGQRWAAIESRRQQALQCGARLSNLETIARELHGDGCLPGILSTILSQIDDMIDRLAHVSMDVLDYPQVWKPWYRCAHNFTALIGRVEQQLDRAEHLVRDGGELHQVFAYHKGQPQETAPARPMESDSVQPVHVET
jgi:hypothetical protein